MHVRFRRTALAAILSVLAGFAVTSTGTKAQLNAGDAGAAAIAGGLPVANSAEGMLYHELMSRKAARDAAREHARRQTASMTAAAPAPGASGAPAAPGEGFAGLETPKPGFLHPTGPGVDAEVDVSSAFAAGDIGYKQNNLPGGADAQIYVAPIAYTRIFAGYFTISAYPVGFDNQIVPSYLQNSVIGVLPTVGRTNGVAFGLRNLATSPANLPSLQVDTALRNNILILSSQTIIYIDGLVPVVISPTYVSRKGTVAGADDAFLAYNPTNFTYQKIRTRTSESKNVLFSVPFANTPKFFGVFTTGVAWNVNNNGENAAGNSAQSISILDLRYFANPRTTLFFEPSFLREYLPTDQYPEHNPTLVAGLNYKLTKGFFIQGMLFSTMTTNPQFGNTGRIGVIDATCVAQYPTCTSPQGTNPRINTATTFGGLRATQFTLEAGIGNPSVIPI